MRKILLLPLVLLAACGGTDPGSGSNTLFVQAEARHGPKDDGTSLLVSVREGSSQGEVVQNATVTLYDEDGNAYALAWKDFQLADWRVGYVRDGVRWSTGWRLEVSRGDDQLEAYLEAPGETTVVRPAPASLFSLLDEAPLTVAWEDAAGKTADRVELSLDKAKYQKVLDHDPGEYEVPFVDLLVADKETLGINRWTEVNLEGGTAGSYFRATVEAEVEFQVQ